jgi:hypothetical protein
MTYSRIKAARNGGFTLVETLTYSFGMLVILGGIVAFIFYLYQWYRSATIPTRTDAAALALMSQIATDLRAANALNDGASAYGTANGRISMTSTVSPNSTTTVYALESGRMKEQVNSAATSTISAGDIWISSFRLTKLATSNATAVRIELGIDYFLKGATSTNTYSDLAVLRQSY